MKHLTILAFALALAAPTSAEGNDPVAIEAAGPDAPLAGTLTPGNDGGPALLLIPGSGPTDRDGNNPMGIAASSYRLLAEALATEGIATVRIDKRGMFGSADAIPDANKVSIADYVADTRAWIEAAREATGAECIWLAGHSEGGLVALATTEANPTDICGLILLAAPGRKMGTILREQLQSNPANAPILPQALSAIERLEQGERVPATDLHPALLPLFGPQVQDFVIDMLAYDPAQMAGLIDLPILILQGRSDIQVAEADALALAEAQPDANLALLDGVTHVLKDVAEEGRAANMATYTNPELPIASSVVAAITEFVTSKAEDN